MPALLAAGARSPLEGGTRDFPPPRASRLKILDLASSLRENNQRSNENSAHTQMVALAGKACRWEPKRLRLLVVVA